MKKALRSLVPLSIALWLTGCSRPMVEPEEPHPPISPSTTEPYLNEVRVPTFDLPHYGSVPTLSFEREEVNTLQPDETSRVRRSDRHFRDGNHSLEWTWSAEGCTLTGTVPVPYKARFREPSQSMDSVSIFGAWLYSEKALPGKHLRVGFGRGSAEDCHFHFGLDFTGWRLICVKFDDMTGRPHPEMDVITFRSPEGIEEGQLWLDQLQPVSYQDLRWQWPDYQMPFIPSRVINELYINTEAARALQARPLPEASQPHIDALTQALVTGYARGTFSEARYAKTTANFDAWHISKSPDRIQGRTIVDIRDYFDQMLEIAVLHHQADADRKRELKRMYVLMTEHLFDQGWVEGSALNAQHHFGYKSRSWAPSALLMADVLRERALLNPMMRSILWFGRDFLDYTQPFASYSEDVRAGMAGRMADYLNTFANTHLVVLLLLEDSAFKDEALLNYREMLSQSIAWENGALKTDGSFYHHRFHYAGYAVPAMSAAASVVQRLDGTPYEIERTAYQRLKTTFLAAGKWGYPHWAFNACGRHPITGSIGNMQAPFEKMAVSVPGTDGVDPELAQVCRDLFGTPGEPALQALDLPAQSPQGFWAMNYAGSGILKWKQHTVLLKGYGPGVRSHETYGKDNRFGRYASHGTMMLFEEKDSNTSGIRYQGWDWSQPPGATTLQLPLDVLEGSAEAFYGWRAPQDAFFSGAGHLDNQVGAFAFGLNRKEHEQSLQVRKSVFAVGGTLVCLGSDITNTSGKYPTVTTLFQWGGEAPRVRLSSSIPVTGSNRDQKRVNLVDRAFWVIDPQGNGYLLPKGNGELVVQRRQQESLHDKTRQKTEGLFAKAWLNHGTGPSAAGYEYLVKLDAEPRVMNELARTVQGPHRPYQVLEKSVSCHALRIPAQGLTFHVFFEAPSTSNKDRAELGDILSTDTPLLAVSRRVKTGGLQLSLTYPDPSSGRAYDEAEPTRPVVLRLKGRFHILPGETIPESRIDDGVTVLRLNLHGSHAHHVRLQPAP